MQRQLDSRDSIVFAPRALHEMTQGFNQLATLLAGTLGPARGPVWRADGNRIERLSDSGVIVRRTVELPDRLQNTGAMQARHMVWRMQERFGDGGATTAVMARAMLRQATVFLAAGADPRLIHDGMSGALDHVERAMEGQRLPISGSYVERLIAASLSEPEIATILAEMIDVLGNEPAIQVEVMNQPYLDRIYHPGGYWKLQPSPDAARRRSTNEISLERPLVLVADDEVLDADDLMRPFKNAASEGRRRPLVIVGAKLTSAAEDLLQLNVARGTIEAFAVSPLVTGAGRHQVMQDMATATGASVISTVAGFSPRAMQCSWFGSARQVLIRRDSLVVIDGDSDPATILERKGEIRRQLDASVDDSTSALLRDRLAGLAEGMGILQIGGITRNERDDKRRQVERILRVLPDLLSGGLVPGGGIAFLACRPALERHQAELEQVDVRHGAAVIASGLEAPFLQLVSNGGGLETAVALERVTTGAYATAFDAEKGMMVPIDHLPVVDSQAVLRGALRLAVSTVGELITTGATILPQGHRRQVSANP